MSTPGFTTISNAVQTLAPESFQASSGQVSLLTSKWQSLLYEALEIPEEDKFTEASYPFEANMLITYLIIKDIIVVKIADTTAGSSSSSGGAIKKIVTGPTEVERFSPTQSYYELSKNGGILVEFQALICALSNKLGVFITGCPPMDEATVVSVLRNSDYSYEHKYLTSPEFDDKI